jgi:hypothetical protein
VTLQMMSLSGHKNAETFKAYIRLPKDEIAKRNRQQDGFAFNKTMCTVRWFI